MSTRRRFLILAAAAAFLRPAVAVEIDVSQYREDVKTLSSDKFKGRLSGTRELDEAAGFLASRFRSLGLKPAGEDGFFQRFLVTTGARLRGSNSLTWQLNGESGGLKLEEDFVPLAISASGNVSGQVVFAGYGITASEYGYDDYEGLDVRGKIVLVMRHEPQEYDVRSVFGGRVYTNHAQLESKVVNAAGRGAAALILVDDSPSHRGTTELEKLGRAIGPDSPGIPVVEIRPGIAERWIQSAGRSFEEVVRAIDDDLRPRSFVFPGSLRLRLSVQIDRETQPVSNVLAWLPGETDEYVIVGAHYDHVGRGEQYSMDPSRKGMVHPGADDNASGVAGILALARWFSGQPLRKRGILFAAFAGEEFGLLGSNHYIHKPPRPLGKAVAMINLDMIGRIRGNKVYVGGTETSSDFKALVEELNRAEGAGFEIEADDPGDYGSSDHYSFTTRQVPFLFFFSGLHPDYHTPSDTWDKVDAPQAARLLTVVGRIIERILGAEQRPRFEKRVRPYKEQARQAQRM